MPNVAVLIDAENVLPVYAHQIFENAAACGTICAKEIYGAAPALTTWVEPVLEYAMHANLTIKASKWKNSSDIALVIGAMDLLIAGNVDTVILVSSDSDFSALSVRLRLAGLQVIGMGTDKTNELWRKACSEFVMLQAPMTAKAAQAAQPAPERKPQSASRTATIRNQNAAAQTAPAARAQGMQQPQAAPARTQTGAQQTVAQKPVQTETASQKPAQPEAAPTTEEKKASAPRRVATTHAGRTDVIREFIHRQMDENHGKMALSVLFQNLRNLPEYQVDQRGSKRKPLNYLMWLFSDEFSFEDAGSGGTWISLKGESPEAAGEGPAAAGSAAEAAVQTTAEAETSDGSGRIPADRADETENGKAGGTEESVGTAENGKAGVLTESPNGTITADAEATAEIAMVAPAMVSQAPKQVENEASARGGEKPKSAGSWAGAVLASIAEAQKAHAGIMTGLTAQEPEQAAKAPEAETANEIEQIPAAHPQEAAGKATAEESASAEERAKAEETRGPGGKTAAERKSGKASAGKHSGRAQGERKTGKAQVEKRSGRSGTAKRTAAASDSVQTPAAQATSDMVTAMDNAQASPAEEKHEAISLYDIGLQNRPLTTLISQGYHTLEDVAKLSDQELMAIKNIGVMTIDQIRKAAKQAGLG